MSRLEFGYALKVFGIAKYSKNCIRLKINHLKSYENCSIRVIKEYVNLINKKEFSRSYFNSSVWTLDVIQKKKADWDG